MPRGIGNEPFNLNADLGDVTMISAIVQSIAAQQSLTVQGVNVLGGLEAQSTTRIYVTTAGNDANTGRSLNYAKRSIKAALAAAPSGTTVVVETGEYYENNPLVIPAQVSIVGDNLRRSIIRPLNPKLDLFHCNNGTYITGLRILNLQRPAFCAAFPCALAETEVQNGMVSSVDVLYSPQGYTEPPIVLVEPPENTGGTRAVLEPILTNGILTGLNIIHPGSLYAERPHISIPPPTAQQAFITASPYTQNCSSISGPFTKSGELIPVSTPLPYDIEDIQLDEHGAGGGTRVDGHVCHPDSPLRSFVGDAFTQVNQGGPGHFVTNNGYAQYVSMFTTFSSYGFKCTEGGQCSISNSVCDMGEQGLVSRGYWPTPITTAQFAQSYRSAVAGFRVTNAGSGYTSAPTVVITASDPENDLNVIVAEATADMTSSGEIGGLTLLSGGGGYAAPPTVTLVGGGGSGATVEAILGGTGIIRVSNVNGRKPDNGSVTRIGSTWHSVMGVAQVNDTTYDVTLFPVMQLANANDPVEFYITSIVSTGGLVFEFMGAGVTYNSLPQFGGQPKPGNEILESAPGKVFYTISDQLGNMRCGPYFSVEQLTGKVTINADSFDLSGLNALGPFKRAGIAAGVKVEEISNNPNLVSSLGTADGTTVPTLNAVKTYVDERQVPSGGDAGQVLAKISDTDRDTYWKTLEKGDVGLANVADILQIGVVEKGEPQGVATLDADGKLADTQIPANLSVGTLTVGSTTVGTAGTEEPYAFYGRGAEGDAETGISDAQVNVSISASGAIEAAQFVSVSDRRVKTHIELANPSHLAGAIAGIPVRTWKYRDTIAHGSAQRLGFVAQEVRDAGLEWAVRTNPGCIPDVYRTAVRGPEEGVYVIEAHTLQKGQKIKYYTHESTGSPLMATIAETTPDSVRLDPPENAPSLFIWGTYIDDLLSVDYDALTAACFAGIQNLQSRLYRYRILSSNVVVGNSSTAAHFIRSEAAGILKIGRSDATKEVLTVLGNVNADTFFADMAVLTTSATAPAFNGNLLATTVNTYSLLGNNAEFTGNLRVGGDLIANGNLVYINVETQITDQLIINNAGTGPAISANQTGVEPIVEFKDDGVATLKVYDMLWPARHMPPSRSGIGGEPRWPKGLRALRNRPQ